MATIGYGSSIEIDDGTSAAFVAFDAVTSITVPSQEQATVESTHLLSANRYREYVAGLIEPGDCGFTCRWSDTAYARVLSARGAAHMFKIKFPDTSHADFAGIITKAEIEVGFDAVVDIKVSLKVTGPVTFTVFP